MKLSTKEQREEAIALLRQATGQCRVRPSRFQSEEWSAIEACLRKLIHWEGQDIPEDMVVELTELTRIFTEKAAP